MRMLGIETPNRSGLPIIEVRCATTAGSTRSAASCSTAAYVTLAAYPLVPKEEVGFRIQLTAINTHEEIDSLIAALEELAADGELRVATGRWRRPREGVDAVPSGRCRGRRALPVRRAVRR